MHTTPTKKSPKFDRHKTPSSNFHHKNLHSSVGECLSWRDPNEGSPEPARSQSRTRYEPEVTPKK
jgi:hypothetical protein